MIRPRKTKRAAERKAHKELRRKGAKPIIGSFFDEDGNLVDGTFTTFPIVGLRNDKPMLVATGFFFEHLGGFITAKHVLDEADIDPGSKFVIIQRISKSEYIPRKVEFIFSHPTADICFGKPFVMQEDGRDIENMVLNRDYSIPPIGSTVSTFAFPNSYILDPKKNVWRMVPDVFVGKVIDYYERCPSGKFKSSCLHTNMDVLFGASGGPVFNESGLVIGVNSSSHKIDPADPDQTPVSFVTPIKYLKEIEIIDGDQKMLFEEYEGMEDH